MLNSMLCRCRVGTTQQENKIFNFTSNIRPKQPAQMKVRISVITRKSQLMKPASGQPTLLKHGTLKTSSTIMTIQVSLCPLVRLWATSPRWSGETLAKLDVLLPKTSSCAATEKQATPCYSLIATSYTLRTFAQ